MASYRNKVDTVFAVINNIPADYHSADLRNYFSQFIETEGFDCFHFRHRPERQIAKKSSKNEKSLTSVDDASHRVVENQETTSSERKTKCCVIRIRISKLEDLIHMYHKHHWLDKNGDSIPSFCLISKIQVSDDTQGKVRNPYKYRLQLKDMPQDGSELTVKDLKLLPELHPPEEMPNGNVGTPTLHFLQLIQQCRLPPKIIKKLGLIFPKMKSNRKYGSVAFDYEGELLDWTEQYSNSTSIRSGKGHEIIPVDDDDDPIGSRKADSNSDMGDAYLRVAFNNSSEEAKIQFKGKRKWRHDPGTKKLMSEGIEEKMIGREASDQSGEDNDTCEEWERHEALYDDPSNQERNKERLFEEPMEVTWDKGSSGLVFYTDAQYWNEQEGDFDEQTADDWDVDMSAYYEKGAGDKDIKNFIQMRQDQRRRDGVEKTDRFTVGITKSIEQKHPSNTATIGQFERYSKGVGRRVMEKHGWKDGQGLGSSVTGIADALDNEGQHPSNKSGLGYQDLGKFHVPAKKKRADKEVMISTVYDDIKETDPTEPLLRRNHSYHLSYRKEVIFKKQKDPT